jgi:hypothetical protein
MKRKFTQPTKMDSSTYEKSSAHCEQENIDECRGTMHRPFFGTMLSLYRTRFDITARTSSENLRCLFLQNVSIKIIKTGGAIN